MSSFKEFCYNIANKIYPDNEDSFKKVVEAMS